MKQNNDFHLIIIIRQTKDEQTSFVIDFIYEAISLMCVYKCVYVFVCLFLSLVCLFHIVVDFQTDVDFIISHTFNTPQCWGG
jgi:hypothetical protein